MQGEMNCGGGSKPERGAVDAALKAEWDDAPASVQQRFRRRAAEEKLAVARAFQAAAEAEAAEATRCGGGSGGAREDADVPAAADEADADGAASACGGTPDDADGDALDEAELAREVDLYAAEHLRDTEPETVALRREEFEAQLRVILSVPKAELRRTLPMIERCARLARERLGESA